ncbi:hypothetical protein, partial [Lacticaseibacillus casei]|uniref:hypothetical protein n=1 Tax=Lacticaseibacillus casei TaxID=1582 RepID=UPI000D42648A
MVGVGSQGFIAHILHNSASITHIDMQCRFGTSYRYANLDRTKIAPPAEASEANLPKTAILQNRFGVSATYFSIF